MRLMEEDIQRHKENKYNVECVKGKVKMSDGDIIGNLCDTIEALRLENQQLQTQVAQYRETLEQARAALKSVSYRSGLGSDEDGIREALAAIDKIGGREDA